MADTPKRLIGPVSLGNSAATVYTCPGATVAILRDWLACNETGSAATLTVSVGADAAGKRVYKALTVAANSTLQLTGNVVLAAGEVVQAYSGTASAISLTCCGLEVT